MPKIDIEMLIDSLDAETVAKYIGMDIVYKGKYKFILCPGHEQRTGHPDNNATNCILTAKGYHCFGCNKTVRMTDMVMEYTGLNFKDSIMLLAEIAGGAKLFESNERVESNSSIKLPLSAEELKTIGLSYSTQNCFFVNKSDNIDYDDTEHLYSIEGNEVILNDKAAKGMSLTLLYKNNKKAYNRLIYNKAVEAIKIYDKALEAYGSRAGSGAKRVFNLFEEDESLSSEVFTGIKNALKKKKQIALKIAKEYQESVDV